MNVATNHENFLEFTESALSSAKPWISCGSVFTLVKIEEIWNTRLFTLLAVLIPVESYNSGSFL